MTGSFQPPPYPFDRLRPLVEVAEAHDGGAVDLSAGTPNDPPPAVVADALTDPSAARGYPPSIGSEALRDAARGWMDRRFGVTVGGDELAACIGTKELVAGVPGLLRLRSPDRDTVLHPEIAYPTYAMGAILAGCRAMGVPARPDGSLDLDAIAADDADRALCLWVNSPSNPTGALDDLEAAAGWGRRHGVPVLSDECYAEFTWVGRPATILTSGLVGVLAVHSVSKRSNLAGARVGFYAGDGELVEYLREVRKHAGFMVPGPSQAVAAVALADDAHVEVQRARYRERLERFRAILGSLGVAAASPAGAFYLWAPAPGGDAWALTERLARDGGAVVAPGDFYGPAGADHIRVAMVQPLERLDLVARRLGL